MSVRSFLAAAVAVCLVLGVAACGNNGEESSSGGSTGRHVLPPQWGTYAPPSQVSNGNIDSVPKTSVISQTTLTNLAGGLSNAMDIAIPGNLPLCTPAVVNGKVYLGDGYGSYSIRCLDATTGALVWTSAAHSDAPSACAVTDTAVAFTTESTTLEVMSPTTGALIWARYLGDPMPAMPTVTGNYVLAVYPAWGATPAVAGPVPLGQIAYGCPGAVSTPVALGCFNASNGEYIWGTGIPQHALSAPVVHNGNVYVTTLDGSITRLALDTGAILAQGNLGATSAPSFFTVGSTVKMVFTAKVASAETVSTPIESLTMANLGLGVEAQWYANTANYLETSTVGASGFFGNNCHTVLGCAYNTWMQPSWSCGQYPLVGIGSVFAMSVFQGSRPVVADNRVYAALGNKIVACDFFGNLLWTYDHAPATSWRLLNPPAAAGGKLVFSDMNGKVMVLNGATGSVLNSWQTNTRFTQQPALANGGIYVGGSNGHLIVIPSGDMSLTGWTQWGGDSSHTK